MTRRTLTNALEVSPEKLAFIHGTAEAGQSKTREVVLGTPARTEQGEGHPANAVLPAEARTAPKRSPRRPRATPRHARAGELADSDDRPSMVGEVLLPITTRLRPETLDSLRRAYLEQKLRRARPDTQQEIVEAALAEWLTKRGYA